VEGPAIYEALSEAEKVFLQTTYTASGMAAISALLMALERLSRPATLVAVPGSYSETLELVDFWQARAGSLSRCCGRMQEHPNR
jgi:cystathionine beta-lyase/cystathionine gamma-synthase